MLCVLHRQGSTSSQATHFEENKIQINNPSLRNNEVKEAIAHSERLYKVHITSLLQEFQRAQRADDITNNPSHIHLCIKRIRIMLGNNLFLSLCISDYFVYTSSCLLTCSLEAGWLFNMSSDTDMLNILNKYFVSELTNEDSNNITKVELYEELQLFCKILFSVSMKYRSISTN